MENNHKNIFTLAIVFVLALGMYSLNSSNAYARDQLRIVGSSTVYPFAAAVAEEFGKKTEFKTPVIESTGSGGGLKLFCAGMGVAHPDITNSSRRIKKSEVDRCNENGISEITEVKIGFDGIVIANSLKGPDINLSLRYIWLALAERVPDSSGNLVNNPYKKWKDIDLSLPDLNIEVLGPPPTSGTRDAFVELAMEGGCKTFPEIAGMKKTDKKAFKSVCHRIREDGRFVEAGENDNLIVQKLDANPSAFGIFGYSFLEQNKDKVKGSKVNEVVPSFENISDSTYPISRSLFFYVKNAHVGIVPGIKEYLAEFTDEDTWGDFGYLGDKGLISLPEGDRQEIKDTVLSLTPLKM